jgi:DNA polymerase III subunit beta
MKIECIKDHLGEAVSKAEKISTRNSTLPALSGLHLSAKQNNLTIKATNLDIGISISLPVKVSEPGEVVVPAYVFSSLLSSLPSEKVVSISTNEQVLEVKTTSVDTHINVLPEEDFPIIPEISDDKAFSLPARDLIFGLKSVLYAAASGSMKPELSSISITHENEFLTFAATDSFRLAEKKIRVRKIPHFKQILIPHRNATEIIRVFDKGEEEISLSIEEHQLALRSNDTYIVSRIVEGVFPDYRQVIPKESVSNAVVLKQDLMNALKTSLIFSDSFNQLTLHINPLKKQFEIESRNNTVGENRSSVDAVLEGEELSINLNYKYFTDCFQSIATDSLNINFSGQAKPILVQPVGDTSFLYLVMPMNR